MEGERIGQNGRGTGACHERQYWACLEQTARQHDGLIISLDGLAPEGGEPQLWSIRALLCNLTLRSG